MASEIDFKEAVSLVQEILAMDAEKAMLAFEPYDSQRLVLNGHTLLLALFGGNQCLDGNCSVSMADGTHKRIQEIAEGDMVLAYDVTAGSLVPAKVLKTYVNRKMKIYTWSHKGGSIQCSMGHKVMAFRGPEALKTTISKAWLKGWPVISVLPDQTFTVAKVEAAGVRYNRTTYDLLIDHPDNLFVADGLVVSNSGKSHSGAHKTAWSATGLYPDWYEGKRFDRGPDIWVVGDTVENTRDNCQKKLFGPDADRPGWTDRPGENALIAGRYIRKVTKKRGSADAFDTVEVVHVPTDTISRVTFKTHNMDRQALASWTGDLIWVDEECPLYILDELVPRIIRRKGQIIITFTPIDGLTPTVKFLIGAPSDICTKDFLGWDQAKHLDAETKDFYARLYASQPGTLKARMEGRPTPNTGLIFPFAADKIWYDPRDIVIPSNTLDLGGMDVGWKHPTGAVRIAWDRRSGRKYLCAAYRQAERPFFYHHGKLMEWGESLTFMIDPASSQVDKGTGQKILEELWKLAHGKNWDYIKPEKRKYVKANNSFMVGMDSIWKDLESGVLRVNKNLTEWFQEYEGYVWNDEGTGPKKVRDDLLDPTRYCNLGMETYARNQDAPAPWEKELEADPVDLKEWKPYRAGEGRR